MDFVVTLLQLIIFVAVVVGLWRACEKADQPGWYAIFPPIAIVAIADKPWWWILLLFIPLVNLIALFLMYQVIAEAFGQGLVFVLGLFFLPFIFFAILGFGDYTYTPPAPAI